MVGEALSNLMTRCREDSRNKFSSLQNRLSICTRNDLEAISDYTGSDFTVGRKRRCFKQDQGDTRVVPREGCILGGCPGRVTSAFAIRQVKNNYANPSV